jgi:hypothetical protein
VLSEPGIFEYRQRLLHRFAEVNARVREALASLATGSKPAAVLIPDAFHLLEAEKTLFSLQIRLIVASAAPGVDLDASRPESNRPDPQQALPAILSEWLSLRQEELGWLRSLPEEGWSWRGDHRRWGKRTVQWWVEKSLRHAEGHLGLASE